MLLKVYLSSNYKDCHTVNLFFPGTAKVDLCHYKGYVPKDIEKSMTMLNRDRFVDTLYKLTYTIKDVYANEIAIVNVHFKSLTVMQVSSISPTF